MKAANELEEDGTARELRHALPEDATVCVLGWPDVIAEALPPRGDLEVLVVDVLDEGSRFTTTLWDADVDAVDIPVLGLGAAAAQADLVLLESPAIGPEAALAVSGSRAAAAVARHLGRPVWLVGGVGRVLPGPMWQALIDRMPPDDPWDADDEHVPLDLVTHVVGPKGLATVTDAVQRPDCAVVAELLRDAP